MMNRQESHRIYLQLFAATPPKASDGSPLNRKGHNNAQPSSESFSLSATLFEGSSRHTVSHQGAAQMMQL